MGKIWTDDDYIIKYDVRQETCSDPRCGRSRLLARFDDKDRAVEYAKLQIKRGKLEEVYVQKRRYASKENLLKDFFMDSSIVWSDWLSAEVLIEDNGMTKCSSCGTEILCDELGDMPGNCPKCRCILDYAIFDTEDINV